MMENSQTLHRFCIRMCAVYVTIRTIAYCRVGKKAVPLQPIYKPY